MCSREVTACVFVSTSRFGVPCQLLGEVGSDQEQTCEPCQNMFIAPQLYIVAAVRCIVVVGLVVCPEVRASTLTDWQDAASRKNIGAP